MTDRIPSDHDTIDTHRVHLSTVGRTRRRQIQLPTALECALGDVIVLSLEGERVYAEVTAGLDGDATVQEAFGTRQLARTGDGENELRVWLDACDLTDGDPLMLDVLRAGYAYGLRRPGERVVYSPPDPPDSDLADIARDIQD